MSCRPAAEGEGEGGREASCCPAAEGEGEGGREVSERVGAGEKEADVQPSDSREGGGRDSDVQPSGGSEGGEEVLPYLSGNGGNGDSGGGTLSGRRSIVCRVRVSRLKH